MTTIFVLAFGLLLRAPLQESPPESDTAFAQLADGALAFHLYFNPVRATLAGHREYDARLPDMSRSALLARAEGYRAWLDRLGSIDADQLVGDAAQDRLVLEYALRAELASLVETRDWERDPALYVDIAADGVASLVEDTGVPVRDRMEALTSRLRQLPSLLAEARVNLDVPFRPFTEQAILGAERLAAFLQGVAPLAFEAVAAGPARTDFERALAQAVVHVGEFRAFLQDHVLLRPGGEAALGADRVGGILRFREHVELEPRQVLAVLERELSAGSAIVADRSVPPEARGDADRSLERAEALGAADSTIARARTYIFRSLFVTVPSDARPAVSIRPPIRGWERADVWGPGPAQPHDGPATLYLLAHAPGEAPSPGDVDPRAAALERGFPGRFLSDLYARRASTPIRKVFRPHTLTDGWSIYAAAALVRDGFDPVLGPVLANRRRRALAGERAALEFHLGDVDFGGATARVQMDTGLSEPAARMVALEAIHRPFRSGILGALQIAQLQRDLQGAGAAEEGSVRSFHDAFLSSGLPPARARALLLGEGAGPALR